MKWDNIKSNSNRKRLKTRLRLIALILITIAVGLFLIGYIITPKSSKLPPDNVVVMSGFSIFSISIYIALLALFILINTFLKIKD